ncbi:enoyl-CoA hydratase/isomerase family protein [Kocuria tytonis]|uniref:Enoyl-CoA hydratase/isomerase family protein n=1 Tax=Kocuria tytonis TaxID=2054280 RepID=A0A495A700_9MICC|nr:enoyl-CoA hydratase-related protein [Kocuria tytonis]RKQ34996.1 enoyl-CoA hydratase/isomerase family protein [Kocuria tytonis]
MIDLTIEDDIARVVLNAPEKRNSLDLSALQELAAAYTEAENAGVRALLLTGAGRVFCAGRDISGVDPATDDAEGYLSGTLEPLMRQMSGFPAPTFAAVQGACLGVGLGLAIATDVVYVAQDAKFGSPFANLGAILDSGGHALFTERLGAHRTLDLIYTAEMMSGAEAVAAGLFSRAVPAEELVEFTEQRVVRASRGATQAFVASKKLVAQVRDERAGLWESMSRESGVQAALCATDDYREGFAAFQQKRTPEFTGKG